MSRIEIRVISSLEADQRRAQISGCLENVNEPWSFFNALNGDCKHWLTQDGRRQLSQYGRVLTPGEIGCFKSHATIWREIAENEKLDWILVLEDDVLWDASFDIDFIAKYCEKMEIDLLRLFVKRIQPFDVVGYLGERQLVRFRTDPYGMQAYLISRRGAQKLMSTVISIDRPVDDELGRFWVHDLGIFALYPFPAIESSQPSTLRLGRDAGNNKRQNGIERYAHRTLEKLAKLKENSVFFLIKMRRMRRNAKKHE